MKQEIQEALISNIRDMTTKLKSVSEINVDDLMKYYNIFRLNDKTESGCSCRWCVESGGPLPCGQTAEIAIISKELPDVDHIWTTKHDCTIFFKDGSDIDYIEYKDVNNNYLGIGADLESALVDFIT